MKPLGVGGRLLGQDFDSDRSPQLESPGLAHFTLYSRTNRLDDFVLAEFGAEGEGHD